MGGSSGFAAGTFYNDVYGSGTGFGFTNISGGATWAGRAQFGVAVFSNLIWVFGGRTGPVAWANDVYSSPDGANWTLKNGSAPWSIRSGMGSVVWNGKIWTLGGRTGGATFSQEVWSSANGVTWALETAFPLWAARSGMGVAVHSNLLFISGGLGTGGTLYQDVYSTTDGISWNLVTAAAPWAARNAHKMVSHEGRLIIFGGDISSGGTTATQDIWESFDGITWTSVNPAPAWSPRLGMGVEIFKNQLSLVGGYDGTSTVNDTWMDTDSYLFSNSVTTRTYRTAQAAVDAAIQNYKVFVYGNVTNGVMINGKTNLSLVSQPWSTNAQATPLVWDGAGAGNAVNIQGGNGVVFAGFQVTNGNTGIYVSDGTNHRVVSNVLSGLNFTGVGVRGVASNHLIAWNLIERNGGVAVDVSSNGLVGVQVSSNTIRGGNGQNTGLRVAGARGTLIVSNDISANNSMGIILTSGAQGSLIRGNWVSGNNNVGIQIESNFTTNNWLQSNVVWGGQNDGLRIQDAKSNDIQQNSFTNQFNSGIALSGSALGNRIAFNNIGLNGPQNLAFIPGNSVVSNFWYNTRLFNITNGAPGTAASDVIPYRLTQVGINQPVVYPPASPTNLALTNNNGAFQITWSPVPGANGYLIYRNTGVDTNLQFGGNYALSPASAYTDVSPLAGVSNFYYVAAYDNQPQPNASWFSSNSVGGFTSNMVSNGNTTLTYTSLASAISAVPNGGNETLWAWPGAYLEHGLIVSNKTVTLRGMDFVASNFIANTLIWATNVAISNAIRVTAGGKLTVEGFTVRFQGTNNNWNTPFTPASAFQADGSGTLLDVHGCRLEGNNVGNSGVTGNNATVSASNNVLVGFGFTAMRVNQGSGNFVSNIVSNSSIGYYHNGSATVNLTGNRFVSNNQAGIYAWDGTGLTATYNVVTYGWGGFYCTGGSPVVEFNTFSGNGTGGSTGLWFTNAQSLSATVQNNIVYGFNTGAASIPPVTLTANAFFSNTSLTNGPVTLSNAAVADPLFLAWPTNLMLTGWGAVPGSGTNGCDPGAYATAPDIRLKTGPSTRIAGTFPTSTNKMPIFQFAITGVGSQTIMVTQVTVSHTGSFGYPLESRITAVHLAYDGNQDGVYTAGPDTILASGSFNVGANSNWITFGPLGQTVTPGANQRFVVAYDVANMAAGESIQAQITNGGLLARTNGGAACPTPGYAMGNPQTASGGVARFSIQHSGLAAVGVPEPLTVTAVDSNNNVVTYYTGTITNWAAGQAGQVAWSTNGSAQGTLVSNGGGVGAVYTFSPLDLGVASLRVADSAADGAVSFLIKDTVTGASNTNVGLTMAFLPPVMTNITTGAGYLRYGDALANLQAGVTNRILVYQGGMMESNLVLAGGFAQFISMPWSNTGDNAAVTISNGGVGFLRVFSGGVDFRGFTFWGNGNPGGGFFESSNSAATFIADRFIGNGVGTGIYNHDGGSLWVQNCFFTNVNGWVLGQNIMGGSYPNASIYVGSNLFLGNTNGILAVVVSGSGGKAVVESNVMVNGNAGVGIVGNGFTRYNLVRGMNGFGGSYFDGANTNHNNTFVGGSQGLSLNNGATALNNIITGFGLGLTNQGSGNADYNLYFANGANYGNIAPGAHDVAGDPVFVNSNAGNFALGAASAAVDGGTNLDGLAQGTARDMGFLESAFSLNTSAVYISTNGNDANPGTVAAPVRSLQAGYDKALSSGKTNLFLTVGSYAPGAGLNASGAGAILTNGSNVTLSGGWDATFATKAGLSLLDGAGSLFHVLVISNLKSSTVEGLVLRGGSATGGGADSYGAGIYGIKNPNLTVTNLSIATNRATMDGGGAYFGLSTNLVLDGYFVSNTAITIGGGLVLDSSPGARIQGLFTNNMGQNAVGGMVARNQSTGTIVSNATFIGNRALTYHIGGLSIQDSSFSRVSDSYFLKNIANIGTAGEGVGGLMVFNSTNVSIEKVRFYSNQAMGWGGGMAAQFATNLAIDGQTLFLSNTSKGAGGALFATGLSGMTNLGIARLNFSGSIGGAFSISNACSNLVAGIFEMNGANLTGGAIHAYKVQGDVISATVISNYVTNNTPSGNGGAVGLDSCTNTSLSGNFMSNTAIWNGGAAFLNNSFNINLPGSFYRNKSLTASSGAVYVSSGNGHQFSGVFAENWASTSGGVAYVSSLIGGTFSGGFYSNGSTVSGGALAISGSCVGLSVAGNFISNTVSGPSGEGGAVYIDATSYANQIGGTFIGNASLGSNGGGALSIRGTNNTISAILLSNFGANGGALTILGVSNRFAGVASWNVTSNFGGGVYVLRGYSNYIGGYIGSNIASNQGGGLFIQQSTNTMVGGTIDSNRAISDGGGVKVFSNGSSNTFLSSSVISRNTAAQGGGVYLRSGTNFLLGNILSNISTANGGGVYIGYEAGNVVAGNVIGNSAGSGYGGGLYIFAATNTTVTNAEISGNSINGAGDGSAIAVEKSSAVTLKNLVMTNGIGAPGRSVVCLRSLNLESGVLVTSNLISGSNLSGMFGVGEVTANAVGVTLSSNTFDPAGLASLYNDFIYNSTNNVAVLNITNYHQGTLLCLSNRVVSDGQVPILANVAPVNGLPVFATGTNITGQVQEWGGNVRLYANVNGLGFALASNALNPSTGYFDLFTNATFTNGGPNVSGLYAVDDWGNTSPTNWFTNWVTIAGATNIVFVDPVMGGDTNIGNHTNFPVKTIQKAFALAGSYGYTNIRLRSGTFTNNGGLSNLAGAGAVLANSGWVVSGGWNAPYTSQAGATVLDGRGSLFHVMVVSNANQVALQSIDFVGGNANGAAPDNEGGGLWITHVDGLDVTNVAVSNNTAAFLGGGVKADFLTNADMTLLIQSNQSASGGGAALGNLGNTTLRGVVAGNWSSGPGAGVRYLSGSSNHLAADVCSNTAAGYAGGVLQESGNFRGSGNVFRNAASTGAGYYLSGSGNLIQGQVATNMASSSGGGLYINCNSCDVQATVFSNTAGGMGGGAHLVNASANILGGTFRSNQAAFGGNVSMDGSSFNTFTNVTAWGYAGMFGGGIYLTNSMSNRFAGSVVSNLAMGGGGGIAMLASHTNWVLGTVTGNLATNGGMGGGALASNCQNGLWTGNFLGNQATVVNGGGGGMALMGNSFGHEIGGLIANNSAYRGGGVWLEGNTNTFLGIISSNNASQVGGGVWAPYTVASNRFGGIVRSNFTGTSSGGGMYFVDTRGGNFDGQVIANIATDGAGLRFGAASTLNTVSGLVAQNVATGGNGGGGMLANGTSNLFNGIFSNNFSSNGNGGGIRIVGASNAFTGWAGWNQALNGGGIAVEGSYGSLVGLVVSNSATADGGGVFISNISINHAFGPGAFIASNRANGEGGGLLVSGTGHLISGRILGNGAARKAALSVRAATNVVLAGLEVARNMTVVDPIVAGFQNIDGLRIQDSFFTNNDFTGPWGRVLQLTNGVTNFVFVSNVVSGTNGATNCIGLEEVSVNVANHALATNLFDLSTLGILYADATFGNLGKVGEVNAAVLTGANLAEKNGGYGDLVAPTTAQTNLVPGQFVGSITNAAMGWADDRGAIQSVFVSLNGGPFGGAATHFNTTSRRVDWATNLVYGNGVQEIRFYAVDNSGNTSATQFLTNYANTLGVAPIITNGPAAAGLWGTATLAGTNAAMPNETTAWAWALDGGAWTSVAANTNAPWGVSFNTLALTNGSHTLSFLTTNLGNVAFTTNATFEVSNTSPVVSGILPVSGSWITNANQTVSGAAASSPAPLVGVGMATNGAPWPSGVSGTASWSTNGPWGTFERKTNGFMVVASNALGWAFTNNLTYLFELNPPAMAFQGGLDNSSISNITNLTALVDSFSPVTALVGTVQKAGVVLSNYDLTSLLTVTNLNWALDVGGYSNGLYDLVLTVTNTAGWTASTSVTNIRITNAPPRVPTFTRFIPLASHVAAGTAVPFHFEVLDQDTNWLKTNAVLPFTFLGATVAPLGQSASVQGTAVGTVTPIALTQGTASNIFFIPVAAGSNVLSNQFFTNLAPLWVDVTGTNPSTTGSSLDVSGSTVDMDVTNRVWVRDLYGNPPGNPPTFVFVKVDFSNANASRVATAAAVATNEYRIDLRVSNGMGRYVFSSYIDGTAPSDRVTRDSQGAVDGWVNLDLYSVASSNLDTLIERNKGGPTVTQNPVKAGDDLTLFFRGNAGQKVTLIVSDLGGRVLRRQEMTLIQDGLQFQAFSAKDTVGRNLPPGIYFILLKTTNPDTQKYFKLVITR